MVPATILDEVPVHYAREVRTLFDQVFPHQWIGPISTIEWLDMNPLDLFFCDILKQNFYNTKSLKN